MPKVFVSGHRGMVGAAIIRALGDDSEKWQIVIGARNELDLCNQSQVKSFFEKEKPEIVINAAAKVGGIHANSTYPAEFIYQNLLINTNLIHAAWENGVVRFLNLGSSCIYPANSKQPIQEDYLLTGSLEKTNEAYALAKIAGLEMCKHYRRQYGVLFHSAMPTNLYGPGDNYHPENSHVLPALIRRFHEAKVLGIPEISVWGTGSPRRELMHADDLAQGIVFLLGVEAPPDWINLGTGIDHSIQEIAEMVKNVVGFEGEIKNDLSRPDGMPLKRLDVSLAESLGWSAKIKLEEGIEDAYQDFKEALKSNKARL